MSMAAAAKNIFKAGGPTGYGPTGYGATHFAMQYPDVATEFPSFAQLVSMGVGETSRTMPVSCRLTAFS